MTFLQSAILYGLFAMLIPPIIHLLSRRRYDVVDWAAMRFLQASRRTRRKVAFEQILLMLLRALLIGLLVVALDAPKLNLNAIAKLPGGEEMVRWAGRSNRDIVLIIDGSYSMDYRWNNQTVDERAKEWSKTFIDDLWQGDRVAIVQAKQQPIPVLEMLTEDRAEVKAKLAAIPRPRGGVDWARAVQEAQRILQSGQNSLQEIIILTDGQRQGWSDPRALEGWQLLALPTTSGAAKARIWVVNVVPDRPDDAPNWLISPITANRSLATVGREVKFKFDLQSSVRVKEEGDKKTSEGIAPPAEVTFEIDRSPAGERAPPNVREPSIGMDFTTRFETTGSHLFSAIIGTDALPGDNRRDFAIDVLPVIPVLIVDGDRHGTLPKRSSDFLRYAIAPPNHPQPSFLTQMISIQELASKSLTNPIGKEAWTTPRVLILQNVPSLSEEQNRSVEEFLKQGGGVFVLLGDRSDPTNFNLISFREGESWLPARLVNPAGDEKDLLKAAYPVGNSVEKTFLDLFKEAEPESFVRSSFSRWWKLDTTSGGGGSIVAELTTHDPLFIEKSVGKGRVLMAAVPFDDSWRTSFLQSHDFVRLCHECLFYLASSRSGEVNLEPRQSLVFRPGEGEPPGGVTIEPPEGPQRRVEVTQWPFIYDDTRETGVYKLRTDSGFVQYFVVQPDSSESVLTACDDIERTAIAKLFSDGNFVYQNDRADLLKSIRQGEQDPDLWWLFLLLVIGLLVAELMVTRSLVKRNPPTLQGDE
ncbi:MAG: VWA domain-containing protein [Planctomycetes bacterium]|nr:VWA domain-containing protein [Planctomycetota bacterium]